MKNVERKEGYSQVCVWPGILLDGTSVEEFESYFKDNLETRIQFLEEVKTLPDRDSNGNVVPETGGRNDLIFAVHKDDVASFAVPRLKMGVRWIEDAISDTNNPNGIIYEERIREYATWDGDDFKGSDGVPVEKHENKK